MSGDYVSNYCDSYTLEVRSGPTLPELQAAIDGGTSVSLHVVEVCHEANPWDADYETDRGECKVTELTRSGHEDCCDDAVMFDGQSDQKFYGTPGRVKVHYYPLDRAGSIDVEIGD